MPARRAEYRLTPAARRDLEAIWSYTAGAWGVDHAHSYLDDMVTAFAALARNPQRAARCDDIRQGYRRRRVGRHMIYFRIKSYGIAVIRVLHDHMEASRHL
jgi:toxin ParE1/3/4